MADSMILKYLLIADFCASFPFNSFYNNFNEMVSQKSNYFKICSFQIETMKWNKFYIQYCLTSNIFLFMLKQQINFILYFSFTNINCGPKKFNILKIYLLSFIRVKSILFPHFITECVILTNCNSFICLQYSFFYYSFLLSIPF